MSLRSKALELLHTRQPLCVLEKNEDIQPTVIFGEDVFGEKELKERLPESTFAAFMRAVEEGKELDENLADQIATAMKEWALTRGATHYTHWFQPLTGGTAEKHDSFITFTGASYHRKMIMNFSSKELIKGEPDASSFPTGGIRSTFEARGYTTWDMSSPSFIMRGPNGSFLVIPTAFCSWTGEVLDMKIPLLRSEEALSKATVRLLHLLGKKEVKAASSQLGVEQEFFAIDAGFYRARLDLQNCGRTLLGAQPSKGQQMEDHYFGTMDRRVLAFIQEAEWNLWKLGIPTKTRHNEVSPSQYEIAPIFEKITVACDHNMLCMAVLKEVARKHGLEVLLHEKPFAGVNGSGKHNNWSISTDTGENLLDPGKDPLNNYQFLLFLSAVIRAISLHGDILRVSIANPGNDHRLGGHEAPPCIISAYVGDTLEEIIESILEDRTEEPPNKKIKNKDLGDQINLKASSLAPMQRDSSDRNRTSPFAFTSNKFEFRAVGSSQSCAKPGLFLNTIVAHSIGYISDELEKELQTVPLKQAAMNVVRKTLKEHQRAIFNGDNYSEEWIKEAKRRGFSNLKFLPEALELLSKPENIKIFQDLGVLTSVELGSHQHTVLENYIKTIALEMDTLLSMVKTGVIPTMFKYQSILKNGVNTQSKTQKKYLEDFTKLVDDCLEAYHELKDMKIPLNGKQTDLLSQARNCEKKVVPKMQKLREICDQLEDTVDDELWPFPKYAEMLHMK